MYKLAIAASIALHDEVWCLLGLLLYKTIVLFRYSIRMPLGFAFQENLQMAGNISTLYQSPQAIQSKLSIHFLHVMHVLQLVSYAADYM